METEEFMEKDERKWSKWEWNESDAATTKTATIEDTKNEVTERNDAGLEDKVIGFEEIGYDKDCDARGRRK